jgi:hypothetical protein
MNDKHHQPVSQMTRYAAGFWAASLLFFLIYSAPHSVHHAFEQRSATGHEEGAGHHGESQQNKTTNNSDCVFQVAASRCAIEVTGQLHSIELVHAVDDLVILPNFARPPLFLSGSFQIRAPPAA